MSDLKDKVNLMKEKFDAFFQKFNAAAEPVTPPAPATPEPTTYTTKDGKVLTITALEVGADVLDGEVAAADGEYKLEDGTIVQVSAGKIVELSSPAEDALPEEMKKMQDVVAKMQAHIESQNSKIEALQSAIELQKQNFSASVTNNKELMELVVELSEQSKVQPVGQEKSFNEMTPLERFRASKRN